MADEFTPERQRSEFLSKIGAQYAQTIPEISRFYFNQFEQYSKEYQGGQIQGLREKYCEKCGSQFDAKNCKVRIVKKIKSNKRRRYKKQVSNSVDGITSSRKRFGKYEHSTKSKIAHRKRCLISKTCQICENVTYIEGTQRQIRKEKSPPNDLSKMTPISDKDPNTNSTPKMTQSAKKRQRINMRLNKLKLEAKRLSEVDLQQVLSNATICL
ncbi:predicted protein [Nematostella vectensis]|uniref:Uncharacterized protein n=1 Tax=Nematostella vectensis TaxID=45351 RepID=A7SDD4_NEMVE|nr:predicted protein [Nematostella vectensis]|eukprot:XP_001630354.1 predicted protein [Nematostella vectensis]